MACLASLLNRISESLDGKSAAGSASDRANTASNTMLRRTGRLSISEDARSRAEMLCGDEGSNYALFLCRHVP